MKHIDLDHKYKINNICYDCLRECKQDYRVMVVKCPIRVSDMQKSPWKSIENIGLKRGQKRIVDPEVAKGQKG